MRVFTNCNRIVHYFQHFLFLKYAARNNKFLFCSTDILPNDVAVALLKRSRRSKVPAGRLPANGGILEECFGEGCSYEEVAEHLK